MKAEGMNLLKDVSYTFFLFFFLKFKNTLTPETGLKLFSMGFFISLSEKLNVCIRHAKT